MRAEFSSIFLRSGGLISLDRERVAIGWGDWRWEEKPSSHTSFSFYFPDFFLRHEKPWLIFENVEIVSLASLLNRLPPAPPAPALIWKSADRDKFFQQCSEVAAEIHSGHLQKAVPYALETSENAFLSAHSHACLISCLDKANRFPLSLYGFWNESEGMLGATPERLFTQRSKGLDWIVETCAVAGTVTEKQKGNWETDEKLREEHEIVVRGIIESLSAMGKVAIGRTALIPFSSLAHLSTALELTLRASIPFESLVKALHPTAALGAYPRERGRAWLLKMQNACDRRRYGAPAGLKGEQMEGHCLVAIRNVQWQDGRAMLGAGCGFVAESDAHQEWQELQMKLKAMKEILHL